MESTMSPRLAEAYRSLFEAISDPGTDSILRAGYQLFGCPLLFVDEYFRVVSMVPSGRIGDPEWDNVFQQKHMDRDLVWSILDEFLSGKKPFYETFYANTGSCARRPRIMGEVVVNDEVQGHVMVFLGDIPLREDDLDIVRLMVKAIQVKISSRAKGMSRWNLALTTKLQDLVHPQTPPGLYQLACDALSAAIPPDYTIVVTPVGQKASQKAFAEYAISELQQLYRNIIAIIYDDVIVTMFGEARRRSQNGNLSPATEGFLQKILDYFAAHDMTSGVSNCFTNMADARTHYRQARLAAQMTMRLNLGQQALFMDLMPLPMFLSVLEYETPETFVHPAIYHMKAYDASHGTDYYQTMRVFALCMHNKDRAAERLNIHRNTLLYRLGRIAELFELPYEDDKVALNVLCSYLLLELGEHGTTEQLQDLLQSEV
jgi:hypothetical protein